MARRVKRKQRTLKIKGTETPAERQSRTAIRTIENSQNFGGIIQLIRQGLDNHQIATHCVDRGWLDVAPKTIIGYLQYYRKARPGMCKPVDPETQVPDGEAFVPSLDHVFDGNVAIVDPEQELMRAIQLQKARLAIAFKNEMRVDVLMQHHAKEITALGDLLEKLAKLRGKIGDGGTTVNVNYGDSVKADLKAIEQEEGQRDMVAAMVQELISNVA